MNCENVQSQLDAWLDGQLEESNRTSVSNHLVQCDNCSQLLAELKDQDASLRAALNDKHDMATRVADRVALAVEQEPLPLSVQNSNQYRGRQLGFAQLWQLTAALAAGFVLAILVFQPWNTEPVPVVKNFPITPTPVGKLTVSTGPVEFRVSEQAPWFNCPTDSTLNAGSAVRTPDQVGCEISATDGNSIRLGNKTDIELKSQNEVNLKSGRLFVSNPNNQSISVSCSGIMASVENGKFDFKCTDDVTEIIALDAPVKVSGNGWIRTLPAGHVARMSQDGFDYQAEVRDALLATSWIHDLIALNPSDPVAAERVESLLATIGQSKVDHLYENEIRAIGQSAIGPLIAFLKSDSAEHQDSFKRRKAAGILAEICTRGTASQLVALLEDKDVAVARLIEGGLKRISGLDGVEHMKADRPDKTRWQNWIQEPYDKSPWSSPPPIKKKKA